MKKIVTFGEILLRLSTRENRLFSQSDSLDMHFGGSEANVAVSLAKMGMSVSMVSRLPADQLGEFARATLAGHGVDTEPVVLSERGRLGLYFLEQGSAIRGSKVIYDRERSAFSSIKKGEIDWNQVLRGVSWLHLSGISAAVSQTAATVCIEAVEAARAQGIAVSVDLNYRKNLWKYGKEPDEIMPDIVKHANLLLGDPATCNLMLGTEVPVKDYYTKPEDLLPSYDALHELFPELDYSAMSLREVVSANHNKINGALYQDGVMYGSKKVEVVPITERIGGGDAFMAGLIFGIINERPLQYTVDFATMSSALKMTIPGDFNMFSSQAINELIEQGTSGKIVR